MADAGLEELAHIESLEALYIGRSKITDAGLKHLVPLKNLKKVNARGSSATSAGAKMLREALPACEVFVDEAHR